MNNEKITKGVNVLPDHTKDKIAHAQKLKDQFKYKEALETLSNIENVNELTIDEQIRFYLLQSFLFIQTDQHSKALETANCVFQKSIKTGNDLVMLDASLARANALWRLGKTEESNNSVLKCKELISKIKNQPEKKIGKIKADLAHLKAGYYRYYHEFDKSLKHSKLALALSEKYGTKRDIASSFYSIGTSYLGIGDFTKSLENLENSLKISKELNDKSLIAYISLQKGSYYQEIGKYDKALKLGNRFLAYCENYGSKRDLSYAFRNIGAIYLEIGDFSKGIEKLENSLKINKILNDKLGMAGDYNGIGEIYRLQGDLNRGLVNYELSLSLFEEMEVKDLDKRAKEGISTVLENIGLIFYEKGELTQALNYVKRSYQLWKEIGTSYGISAVLFDTIPIYLDQNDLESAQNCLEELKNLSEKEEDNRINHRYHITKALILKKTGGTRNIIRAEDILNKLLQEKSIENHLLVFILLNLCELLYNELQITNETEILEEIHPLITRLYEISEKMHSFSLLAEVNVFKAKYELINLELDEAQRLLTKAQQIAQKYKLSRLEKKISMEHDQLLEKLDIWKELKNRNAPISERLKLISFEGDLTQMMRKKEIERVEILPEEPLMLSIISNGGVSLFMHFFSKEWDDKLMFGSFMTAFNMFSHEFFSKALDRVKIGDNTIIMVPFEDKFLCYVIKGQTYPAQQKLNKLSEGIKNSEEILDAINSAFSTGAVLNNENAPGLVELVNTLFV